MKGGVGGGGAGEVGRVLVLLLLWYLYSAVVGGSCKGTVAFVEVARVALQVVRCPHRAAQPFTFVVFMLGKVEQQHSSQVFLFLCRNVSIWRPICFGDRLE